MKYQNTWDLESIFPGGTKSKELQTKLQSVGENIADFEGLLHAWNVSSKSSEPLIRILEKLEVIEKGLFQCGTFVQMSHDANTKDEYANVVMGQIMDLKSRLDNLLTIFTKKLVAMEEELWQELLQDPSLSEVAFALNEIRDQGKRLLSEEEEKIINDLNKDGLAGWGQIYDTVVSTMNIPFTDQEGNTVEYSVGQAMNRMYSDTEPKVREQLFVNWEEAWKKNAPIFADIINHLSGYRITLQKAHSRKHYLDEPLEYNRMTKETLDAMWGAIASNKESFKAFLARFKSEATVPSGFFKISDISL